MLRCSIYIYALYIYMYIACIFFVVYIQSFHPKINYKQSCACICIHIIIVIYLCVYMLYP